MKVTVLRLGDNGDATVGALYIDGILQCGTIEDEERDVKVKGETRVPEGIYQIQLRAEGGFHRRYKQKYKSMHKGMLCIHNTNDKEWILNAAGMQFQYILIHTGNTDEHTAGCLLVNMGIDTGTYRGNRSVDAYKLIYPKIVKALEKGEQVLIEYIDAEPGR